MSEKSIRQLNGKVLENESVTPGVFRLTLKAIDFPENVSPGQFVMVRTSDGMDPLLRRPFSIHDVYDREIKILYKVVGKGTDWLSRRNSEEEVDLIGPLGRGFELPTAMKRAVIVAGGIGVAPFAFLIRILRERGVKTSLFFGAQCKEELVGIEELEGEDLSITVATDDGSRGEKGRIVDVLGERMGAICSDEACRVYACGPHAMLSATARLCSSHGLPCEVSLESGMACGLGTCMGCVTGTKKGYQRICREGPVFSAEDVVWNAMK